VPSRNGDSPNRESYTGWDWNYDMWLVIEGLLAENGC
jgi:hypothetical protein